MIVEKPINNVAYDNINITTLLAGIVTLLSLHWFYKLCKDKIRFIKLASKLPGPPAIPFLGNVLQLATTIDDSLDKLSEMVRSYPTPMRFWLGTRLCVILSEPRDYEVVLQSPNASHKDWSYKFLGTYAKNGLVTSSGLYHRAQRKLLAPMQNAKALNTFMDNFNHHTRICVQMLAKQIDRGEFNIQHYLAQCSWDFTTETILGVPSSVQTSEDKNCILISERMYELVYERSINILYYSDYLFSFSSLSKLQKMAQDMIEDLVGNAITLKKKEYADSHNRGDSQTPKLIILEQLIDAVMESKLMSDEEIRDCIFTIFTAAQDTTAVISAFALLHLAIDQTIQDKVREEIKNVVGDGDVTTEQIKDLKYTEMVIKETIRLYPIGPILQRLAMDDISLDQCVIPKGCTITMVPYVTHRSEKFWTEPEKFMPERFLPENSNTRHPYAYIPFSSGIRSCIGQQYAITSIKVIIAHIIRSYRLNTTTNAKDIRVKMDVSVRSRIGYNVSLTRV